MNNSGFPLNASSFLTLSFKDNLSVTYMKLSFMGHASHTASAGRKPAYSICIYKFTGATSFRSEKTRQQQQQQKSKYVSSSFSMALKRYCSLYN